MPGVRLFFVCLYVSVVTTPAGRAYVLVSISSGTM